MSLLAGIDMLTGKVHALVKERHRSREFIEFLKLLDKSYAADTAIHLILANKGVPTAPRAARRSFQNATTSSRLKFGELSLGGQMCGYKS